MPAELARLASAFGRLRAQPIEDLALRLALRVLRLIGAGEVTHHQRRASKADQRSRAGRNGLDLGGRQAKPVHAAVDMHRSRAEPLRALAEKARPLPDLLGAVQHRAEIVLAEEVSGARHAARRGHR